MQRYNSVIIIGFQMIFSFLFSQKKDVFLCYGKTPVHEIINYKYVIVEAAHYNINEVEILKRQNTKVVAYISLGEINKSNSFYNTAKEYTLKGKNNNWNSYYLDISKKNLRNILLDDIKSKIINKGFNGLFLDNIDNFGKYGKQKHLLPNLISFIEHIKTTFPDIHIMQNAGLDIVPKTSQYINSIAIESIFSNYDFDKKQYSLRKHVDAKKRVKPLLKITDQFNIPIILIEYTNSKKCKRKIRRRSKKYNFSTFIGQIDLLNLPTFK